MPEQERGMELADDTISLNPASRGILGRIVLVCGAITAGVGVLILLGWASGLDAVTAMGTRYIPTAPNTALLFAVLGSAVLVRELWPASRIMHRTAVAAALFSAVVASVTLAGFATGLNIDDWLFRTTRMLGAVPIGRMSPITAFCFVLAGVSLLLLEWRSMAWAAILGTLIALAGAVCLMGYGFGAPLFYGGTVIPVALPTSLALVALGVGLTAAAGPDAWPLNTLMGPSTRARLLRALLPTVVLLALIADWIHTSLVEYSDPGVVLVSATTAISFLLVVSYAVTRVSGAVGDAIDRSETERKLINRELQHKTELAQLLEQLARAANEAVSPGAAMETCLRRICEDGNWVLGRVATFRTAEPRSKAEHSQWFCTEPARFDAFMRYCDRFEFKVAAGRFVGKVLREQRPMWLADLTQFVQPGSDRLARAVEAGLQAAFVFPIIVGGEAVAVLEFFATETRPPDTPFVEGTTGLASQFARMIERGRANETQARLAAIVERSNDAIIGRTIDGTITSWNAAAERLFGYTAAEAIGREMIETFPPEGRQGYAERCNAIAAGEVVPEFETVRMTKDGRRVDVATSLFPIMDTSGRIFGLAGILRDVSERKRAERVLRSYTARLQAVSHKLLEVQEDERKRLALELHDHVGQVLTALKINLKVIERQPVAAPVALKIEECARIADAALQQVRALMLDLRPVQLDELGLAVALRAHAEQQLKPAGLVLRFSAPDALPEMPPAIEIVCFRIAQEALTNILRHAGARNVWIELAVAGDGLELTVRDDGKGFDLTEAHRRTMSGGNIGLLSMEERAALADGRIEISTVPGAGTTVRAMFSLQTAQPAVDTA